MASRDSEEGPSKGKQAEDFVLVDEYDCVSPEERPDVMKLHSNSPEKIDIFISTINDKFKKLNPFKCVADHSLLRGSYLIKYSGEEIRFLRTPKTFYSNDTLPYKFVDFMELLGIAFYECETCNLLSNIFKDNTVVRSMMDLKLPSRRRPAYALGYHKYSTTAGTMVFSKTYLDDELMYRIYNTIYNYILSDDMGYNATLPSGKMPDATDLKDLINLTDQHLKERGLLFVDPL